MIRPNSFFWIFLLSLILSIEPTIIGIRHPICFLSTREIQNKVQKEWFLKRKSYIYHHGAIIRGDTSKKNIALVFTGDEFADGAEFICNVLKEHRIKASFFLTGNFYRNPLFKNI